MQVHVGLDIGASYIRALAVAPVRGGLWRVTGHASVARQDDQGLERPLAPLLEEVLAQVGARSPDGAASSELEVLVRFLPVPPLPAERLQRLLRLELSQAHEGLEPAIDALRLAVPGEDLYYAGLIADVGNVRLFLDGLKQARIIPRRVGHGPTALAAAALGRIAVEDGQLALVCDIGSSGTDLALVGDGRLMAMRRIPVGGRQFTEALIEAGLTPSRAEAAKIAGEHAAPKPAADDGLPFVENSDELRLDDDPVPVLAAPGAATLQIATEVLGPGMAKTAEVFYGQITSTMAFFRAQLKHDRLAPQRVYLCGGGSALVGLDTYLQRRLQMPVERWNPLADIGGTAPADGHAWARALGLAVGPAAGLGADLRPDRDKRREAWRTRIVWPWVAAACILLSGIIAAYLLGSDVERIRTTTAAFERAVNEHKRLSGELAALEKDRDALADDLRAIAARVHGARDLLYTIRAIKEQCPKSKELWITELKTVNIGKDAGSGSVAADPRPAGRTRVGGMAKPARQDTLIDRGAVELRGMIKFDGRKSDNELRSFFLEYQRALESWTMPDAPDQRLFSRAEELNSSIGIDRQKAKDPAKAVDTGQGDFALRCHFQPTRLDPMVEQAVEAQVTP